MLLLVTIGLVVIAAVALVIGFVSSTVAWIYVSIVCSAIAGVVLYLFSRMSKRKMIATTPAPSPLAPPPAMPANTTAMATTVASFLCPSDAASAPLAGSGPVNYVFCTGSGSNGGDESLADGVFVLGPVHSLADLTDGSSSTVAGSE